jgi:hypothetical protein
LYGHVPVLGYAVLLASSLHLAGLWKQAYGNPDVYDAGRVLGGALATHLATLAASFVGALFFPLEGGLVLRSSWQLASRGTPSTCCIGRFNGPGSVTETRSAKTVLGHEA